MVWRKRVFDDIILRMIPLFKPSLGEEEIEAVSQVLRSGWIGNGPKTQQFEKEFLKYINGKNCVATNSASAALHLALLSLNIKKGDEIITPSLTFVATNHPILMVGGIPVFCDVEKDTLCADPEDILKKITKKTKAIIVVHYGGHPVNMAPLLKICKEKNIALIEDCAHGAGSFYNNIHVGNFGSFGCFSFAAIKNLTTGDGGMIVGKDKKIVEKARTLAWSGISQSTWERSKEKTLKWQYNVTSVGWKYQMNDIAAAIGLIQLKKLEKNNKERKKITEQYNNAFKDISWIETPMVKPYATSSYHNYVIKVPEKIRDSLSDFLAEKGISTSVHYMPSHYYPMYSKYKTKTPITNIVWKKILLLPIFPGLIKKDLNYIIDSIIKYKA